MEVAYFVLGIIIALAIFLIVVFYGYEPDDRLNGDFE